MTTVSANGLGPHDPERKYLCIFVIVNRPTTNTEVGGREDVLLFGTPRAVVHDTGERVWVEATYSDELPEGALIVGDGTGAAHDVDGNLLVSVPVSWCHFITDKKANDILEMIDLDEEMLGWAN